MPHNCIMQDNHGLIGNDAESKFAIMTSLVKSVMVKCVWALRCFLGTRGWNLYESWIKKCQNLLWCLGNVKYVWNRSHKPIRPKRDYGLSSMLAADQKADCGCRNDRTSWLPIGHHAAIIYSGRNKNSLVITNSTNLTRTKIIHIIWAIKPNQIDNQSDGIKWPF